ncbi:MAG: tetratricopeptide repeat protein [Bryobacterales bacterium]|nr:tetratricopeptide repeat protein [Bryobacterales bacterium]
MDPNRADKLDRIYRHARLLPAPDVKPYLDQTCAGDPSLRAEVESLLEETRTSLHDVPTSVNNAELIAEGTVLAHRFQIRRFLGRGGMGDVYLAADRELGGDVALKTLKPALLANPRFLVRFRREVHLGRQVTHPNLCRVFDVGSDLWQGRPIAFFTMEYLPGETLAQCLRRDGAMSVDVALPFLRQMAGGMDALHAHGIAHRDLKPGNIMLVPGRDGKPRAVITDFGLARSFEIEPGDEAVSREGQVIGTPQYMAPEQRMGDPGTAASDLFALGLIMFEMVTGQRAADAASASGRPGRIPPPATLVPGLPVSWNDGILRCLALEAEDRPETASAAVEGLLGASGEKLLPIPGVLRKAPRRWVLGVAGGVLLLGGLGGALFLQYRGGEADRRAARAEAEYLRARDLLSHSYRRENVEEATRILTKVVEQTPAFALGHAGLGLAHWHAYRIGGRNPVDLQKALEESQRALELDPNLVRAHVTLGSIYSMSGKTELAAASLDRAKALEPRSPEVFQALAELYRAVGRDAEIGPALRQAADLAPEDWRPLLAYGVHLRESGKPEEAAVLLRRAVEVSPRNPIVLSNFGLCLIEQGRFRDALDAFERALRIEPRSSVYVNLGYTLMMEGRAAEAIAPFRKALESNPSNYLYHANLASALFWSNTNGEDALQHYRRAAELAEKERSRDPRNARLLANMSGLYASIGDKARSIALVRQALALSPDNRDVALRAAETYEKLGDREEALRLVRKTLSLGYPPDFVRRSPELEALRADPRFSYKPAKGLW